MKLPENMIRHVDLEGVSETFADSFRNIFFDGHELRLEFCVTRMDEVKEGDKHPRAKRYTTCRVVLTADAAVDLFNSLQQLVAALEKDGKVQRNIPTPVPGKPN